MTTAAAKKTPPDGLTSRLTYLARALKTPTIGRVWEDLADQARDANWSHDTGRVDFRYLALVHDGRTGRGGRVRPKHRSTSPSPLPVPAHALRANSDGGGLKRVP